MKPLVSFLLLFVILGCARSEDQPATPPGEPLKDASQKKEKTLASPLAKALQAGAKDLGRLSGSLQSMRDEPVTTADEANLICNLLKRMDENTEGIGGFDSPLHSVIALFQRVESREAYEVLSRNGIPELCRLCDVLSPQGEEASEDVMFLLKILAMYASEKGTDCVLKAAKKPYEPDAYMWSVILSQFDEKHPQSIQVMDELSARLPPDFLGVSLLDAANQLAIAGIEFRHPFDTAEGISRLGGFLTSRDEDEYSYAHSAAASLPFLKHPESHDLLALALDHSSVNVQMEGAWAAVKRGNASGTKLLKRWCKDVRYAQTAMRYLEELGLEDEIPKEARDADFRAMAEMCEWLAHPQEFGRVPDRIELFDSRELFWPPTNDRRRLWLFKYHYAAETEGEEADEGLGMVGSVTFALFGEATADLKPLEAYALHCCWELERYDGESSTENRIASGLKSLKESNSDIKD